MKHLMCKLSFCHYDPEKVEEVLTCEECPYSEYWYDEDFIKNTHI